MSHLHSFNYVENENADKSAKPFFERVVHNIAINQGYSHDKTMRAGKGLSMQRYFLTLCDEIRKKLYAIESLKRVTILCPTLHLITSRRTTLREYGQSKV